MANTNRKMKTAFSPISLSIDGDGNVYPLRAFLSRDGMGAILGRIPEEALRHYFSVGLSLYNPKMLSIGCQSRTFAKWMTQWHRVASANGHQISKTEAELYRQILQALEKVRPTIIAVMAKAKKRIEDVVKSERENIESVLLKASADLMSNEIKGLARKETVAAKKRKSPPRRVTKHDHPRIRQTRLNYRKANGVSISA